jgi:hypothetical protein
VYATPLATAHVHLVDLSVNRALMFASLMILQVRRQLRGRVLDLRFVEHVTVATLTFDDIECADYYTTPPSFQSRALLIARRPRRTSTTRPHSGPEIRALDGKGIADLRARILTDDHRSSRYTVVACGRDIHRSTECSQSGYLERALLEANIPGLWAEFHSAAAVPDARAAAAIFFRQLWFCAADQRRRSGRVSPIAGATNRGGSGW